MLHYFLKKAPVVALTLASAGLLSAATAPSSTTFTGSITLTASQFDNYFVYDANSGALSGAQGVGITNPLTGQKNFVPNGTFPVTETIPQYISTGTATALGLYSPTGVSIAVNQSVYNAAVNTETWDQVFTGTSESSIATALAAGDSTTLLNFLNMYSSDFINFSSNTNTSLTGGILHFSNAAPGGSVTFSSVTAVGDPNPTPTPTPSATPEPSTELLMGAGFSVLALLARKFRKA